MIQDDTAATIAVVATVIVPPTRKWETSRIKWNVSPARWLKSSLTLPPLLSDTTKLWRYTFATCCQGICFCEDCLRRDNVRWVFKGCGILGVFKAGVWCFEALIFGISISFILCSNSHCCRRMTRLEIDEHVVLKTGYYSFCFWRRIHGLINERLNVFVVRTCHKYNRFDNCCSFGF